MVKYREKRREIGNLKTVQSTVAYIMFSKYNVGQVLKHFYLKYKQKKLRNCAKENIHLQRVKGVKNEGDRDINIFFCYF